MQRTPIRRRCERGMFIIALTAVLIIIGLGLTTRHLVAVPHDARIQREHITQQALYDAKRALLAFAIDNRNRPGGLPCPDRDGDGEAELTCDRPETRIGMLPWQTLATGELRDGSGEPLWYALAYEYRNDPDMVINVATPATVRITTPGAAIDDGVAVVLAAGSALPGQARGQRSATNRDSYLESVVRADDRGLEFESRGNDRLSMLAAAELWRAVEPIVALRLARDITPLIESEYAARWGALPYPTTFTDPAARTEINPATTREPGGAPAREGALPAIAEGGATWSLPSIGLAKAGGTGTLEAADCRRSIATEVRCDVRYQGALRIRIDARALDVGFALVAPPTTTADDFGPTTLTARSIELGPLAQNGSVPIVAYAELPSIGSMSRVHLHAPRPIRPLVDPRIPVADPRSWFARNQWYRLTLLAIGSGIQPGSSIQPGGGARPCGAAPVCVRIANDRAHTSAPAVLVFSGRARHSSGALRERYFEGENATPGDDSFDARPNIAHANDRLIVLCANNRCERQP